MEAKLGVAHVVRNRMNDVYRRWPRDLVSVILQPFQFSSFNPNDPNVRVFPHGVDHAFDECCAAADAIMVAPDNTGQAVYYFSKPLTSPPHSWGPVVKTTEIGSLQFFR